MVPDFNHEDRRAKTMVDPFKTADKVDEQGRQVQLLTEAVNILNARLIKLEENTGETKRGPGRPKKSETQDKESDNSE